DRDSEPIAACRRERCALERQCPQRFEAAEVEAGEQAEARRRRRLPRAPETGPFQLLHRVVERVRRLRDLAYVDVCEGAEDACPEQRARVPGTTGSLVDLG